MTGQTKTKSINCTARHIFCVILLRQSCQNIT